MVPSFLAFGFLGYWTESIDLLLVTGIAVGIAAAVGIPLGLWMGHSKVVTAIVTPVLDVMQTMPSFVYLLPISILFGIGAAAAIIVTLIYATPPGGPDHRARHPHPAGRGDGGDRLDGPEPSAAAHQGRAAAGQAHHHRRASTRR